MSTHVHSAQYPPLPLDPAPRSPPISQHNGFVPPPPPMSGPIPPPPPPPAPVASSSHHPPAPPPPKRSEKPAQRQSSSSRPSSRHTSQRSAPAPKAPPPTANRLKRETPFIGNIRFKNEVPEVPCDPKIIVRPLRTDEISAFALTQLEQSLVTEMVTQPQPGHLSLIDIHRYQVPEGGPPPIDPADQFLLDGGSKMRGILGKDTQLSWLLRTRFLSAHDDIAERRKPVVAPTRASYTRVELISEIEASFAAAQEPPKHCRNPDLVPVEIMPLLPDDDLWINDFCTATCESSLLNHLDVPRASAKQRQYLTDHGILKPFSHTENGQKVDFMALVVPKAFPPDSELHEPGGPTVAHVEPAEGEYRWVRELSYRTEKKATQKVGTMYCIQLKGSEATYVPISRQYVLGKRRRQDMAGVPIPHKLTVERRAHNEEEAERKKVRLQELYSVEADSAPAERGRASASQGASSRSTSRPDLGDLFSDDE